MGKGERDGRMGERDMIREGVEEEGGRVGMTERGWREGEHLLCSLVAIRREEEPFSKFGISPGGLRLHEISVGKGQRYTRAIPVRGPSPHLVCGHSFQEV